MRGYSFSELVKLAEGALKRNGDTATGNLTAPKFLLSAPQAAEPNSVVRKDFFDSTVAGLNAENSTMKLSIWEAMRRTYAEAGFNLVPGSFELGGTVTTATDVLLYEADGHAYNWDGVFPVGGKVVPQNSTPTTTGGVGPGLWLDAWKETLRSLLSKPDGYGSIGSSHLDVTVKVPSDFSTLQSAFDYLYNTYKLAPSVRGIIMIESGHQPASGIVCKYGDYSNIWLRSEDAVVLLPAGFTGGPAYLTYSNSFIHVEFAHGPVLDCLVNAQDNCGCGYLLGVGSVGNVRPSKGVRYTTQVGLLLSDGSKAVADRSIFDYSTEQGLHVTAFGDVSAAYADFSNCRGGEGSSCASVVRNSRAYLRYAKMNNSVAGYGLRTSSESTVDAFESECLGNYRGAMRTTKSHISAPGAKVQKGLDGACLMTNGGSIFIDGMMNELGAPVDISFFPLNKAFNVWNSYGAVFQTSSSVQAFSEDGDLKTDLHQWDAGLLFGRVSGAATNEYAGRQSGDSIMKFPGTATPALLAISRFGVGRAHISAWDSGAGKYKPWNQLMTQLEPRIGATITLSADNSYDFGTASFRGRTAYFATGSINTSDAREKTNPVALTDALLDVADEISIDTWKWLDAIAKKGEDSARWHFGPIAQQVRDAFAKHGLDGRDYGLLCYDKWGDQFEDVLDDDGAPTGEQRMVTAAGDRWGIRPDQCLWLKMAAVERRCKRLEERLDKAGL